VEVYCTDQRPKWGGFFTPRLAPPLVFILRPHPASSRKKLSPPRPAPLFQGISINGIDTKGRNVEDLLLPTSPCPAKTGPRLVSPPRFGLWYGYWLFIYRTTIYTQDLPRLINLNQSRRAQSMICALMFQYHIFL
jgi:hypothetical protein